MAYSSKTVSALQLTKTFFENHEGLDKAIMNQSVRTASVGAVIIWIEKGRLSDLLKIEGLHKLVRHSPNIRKAVMKEVRKNKVIDQQGRTAVFFFPYIKEVVECSFVDDQNCFNHRSKNGETPAHVWMKSDFGFDFTELIKDDYKKYININYLDNDGKLPVDNAIISKDFLSVVRIDFLVRKTFKIFCSETFKSILIDRVKIWNMFFIRERCKYSLHFFMFINARKSKEGLDENEKKRFAFILKKTGSFTLKSLCQYKILSDRHANIPKIYPPMLFLQNNYDKEVSDEHTLYNTLPSYNQNLETLYKQYQTATTNSIDESEKISSFLKRKRKREEKKNIPTKNSKQKKK